MQASMTATADRVGLGWRPEIGIHILEKLHAVDILEITAEHCFDLSTKELQAFHRLTSHVSVMVHALSLGLASVSATDRKHIDKVSRIVNEICPEAWSEHLAFVRSGEIELGHLTAPPWCNETIEGALKNVAFASSIVGSTPHLENIATLYKPPGSTMSEASWTSQIIGGAKAGLLFDLENLYANAFNFSSEPFFDLMQFPLETVRYVHIAGGKETHDQFGTYFIDDHRNQVSPVVFELLERLAFETAQPLTVILERDGDYPDYSELEAELQNARKAMKQGRMRRNEQWKQKIMNG